MPDRRGVVWVQVMESWRGGRAVVHEQMFLNREDAIRFVMDYNAEHYITPIPVPNKWAKLKYEQRGVYFERNKLRRNDK